MGKESFVFCMSKPWPKKTKSCFLTQTLTGVFRKGSRQLCRLGSSRTNEAKKVRLKWENSNGVTCDSEELIKIFTLGRSTLQTLMSGVAPVGHCAER